MTALGTLKGISDAREELYTKTMSGDIPESRANVLDRILRGQTYLNGDLPLKFLRIATGFKGSLGEEQRGEVIRALQTFLTPNLKTLT